MKKYIDLDNLTPREFEDVVNDSLPAEPFIAVFGSSNTYGSCKRDEDGTNIIARHMTYVGQLASKLNMPVINLGVPGVINTELIQLICEFLYLPKVKQHCKHIIAEVRYCESTTMLSPDCFGKSYGEPYFKWWLNEVNEKLTSQLLRTRDIECALFLDKVATLDPSMLDNDGFLKKNTKNFKNKYSKMFVINELAKRIPRITKFDHSNLTNMFSIPVKPFGPDRTQISACHSLADLNNIYNKSVAHLMDDLVKIFSMQAVVNASGIEFNWFTWPAKQYLSELGTDNKKEFLSRVHHQFYRLFESEFKAFEHGAAAGYLYETGELPDQCECGHNTEILHTWIAEKIVLELGKKYDIYSK